MLLKWSQFIFWVESSKNSEEIIMRNTLTGGTVIMQKRIKNTIDRFLRNKFLRNKKSKPSLKIQHYVRKLIRMSILVPAGLDEQKKYFTMFLNKRRESSIFTTHILPTTNCQLACPYCYEQGIDQTKNLNFQTADRIIKWCKNYINSNSITEFVVIFYGGEPLLRPQIIRYILPRLYRLAKNKNLMFRTKLVTNGVLLNFQIASLLKKYNWEEVQVTLDGPRKVHNQRRIKKNGEGTFDQIFQNILGVIKHRLVKTVNLRMNFDRENVDYIPDLLDFLSSYHLQNKIHLSFGIITSSLNASCRRYIQRHGLSQSKTVTKYVWLCEEAKKRGFEIPEEFMTGPWCVARSIHGVIIGPDGSLSKCVSGIGRKEFVFGNVSSERSIEKVGKTPQFSDFTYLKECLAKNCPFVPICGGGCRFDSFVASGNFRKPYCQRELLEKINKGLLRLNFG